MPHLQGVNLEARLSVIHRHHPTAQTGKVTSQPSLPDHPNFSVPVVLITKISLSCARTWWSCGNPVGQNNNFMFHVHNSPSNSLLLIHITHSHSKSYNSKSKENSKCVKWKLQIHVLSNKIHVYDHDNLTQGYNLIWALIDTHLNWFNNFHTINLFTIATPHYLHRLCLHYFLSSKVHGVTI